MNIILLFVNHAVFIMFQFLCLDNGNNVAARRVGHFDRCINDNEHRIHDRMFYTDTRKQRHTIAYKTPS